MIRLATSAAALALLAGPAIAAGVEGLWNTEANEAGEYLVVEVGPCADKTCGVIVAAMNAAGEADPAYENLGRNIIIDMVPDGENKWDDGEIWAPDDDKTYSSSMELKGDVLSVEGCVLVFCRGQDWTRTN
ncbi:MAG: DUF2147 domain-containing protein [Pseudomonadota bacterium]